jgi:hypothetical protein
MSLISTFNSICLRQWGQKGGFSWASMLLYRHLLRAFLPKTRKTPYNGFGYSDLDIQKFTIG